MDREYFLNARNAATPLWNLMTPATEMSFPPEQIPDRFLHHPSWDKSTDQYTQFDSALSSMASSPVASNSGDAFAIRELIGKLGNICNAGEISPQFLAAAAAATNSSCYSTPLNSPPKMNNLPVMDPFVKENLSNMRNSLHLNPGLPSLATDPGFAERAAKFSCFGSRSFNGRTNSQFGLNVNNPEFQFRSSVPLVGANSKLPRVLSSPSLKVDGSPPMALQDTKNHDDHHPTHMEIGSAQGSDKKFNRLSASAANSNEESSVSEQIPSQNDSNSRKRKAAPRGKAKEIASATKENEALHDSSAKKIKQTVGGHENGGAKTEEGTNEVNNGEGDEGQNQAKNTPKPPEPPKDYIHVRARRGQATDSHSLAERVRREKISERMKLLQDLVPGCNKVTGKALMLDEIINYVQSLQRQVEFLSMKLATVNPRLDFDMNSLLSKDMNQSNVSLGNQMYPMESTASAFFVQQQQNQQAHNNNNNNIFNGTVDPLPLPVHGFSEIFPQFPAFCEDDLHSIVHMGFNDTLNRETMFQPQTFQSAQNQASEMKVEL